MEKLTNKQRRFCEEYLVDFNATQAAIRCGYSEKAAYNSGYRILKKPYVKAYIDEKLKEMEGENIASAKEVMIYLTKVLRGESQAEIVVIEGEGDGVTCAKNFKKAPDEKERLKAAELLGKRFGIYKEQVEVSGMVPVVITGDDRLDE